MQLLNKADIDKIFSMKEAVEAVKEALPFILKVRLKIL